MAPVLLLPLGMAPLAAHALGLGELRVTSALGQPLQARIELIGASAAEAELAKVGLASAEEYRRLGVDGSLAGVALHFAVKAGDNGRPYVSVTSYEPVREPYLDFVVEAISPSGQVARHYTVLLDPVGSPPLAPMASPAPVWSAQPALAERRAPRAFNPFANVGQPRPGATYGPVPPGVTLWTVARRVCPPGADLDAVMAAIVRANPQAFINGDPARLKAGVKLTIPEARELRHTPPVAPLPSSPPAAAEVAASPAPAPAETAPAPAAPPTAAAGPVEAPAPAAEVRVLRSEDAKAPAAPVSGTAEAAGASRVQLLEEALDAAQQQNEALQQRLGALEEQIKTLTELVKTVPGSEAGAAAVPGAAGGVAAPAPATPALPAAVAPAPAAAPAGGVLSYVLAAAAGLGLGGLLLWRQRRRGRGEPVAPVAATTAEGGGAAPPTQVEGVEPAPAAPAPATAAPAAAAPTASAGESAAPAASAARQPADDGFGDPVDTQIDLLAAYVGMGDGASARQVFAEIQRTGTPEQVAQAAAVLARLEA